MLLIFELHSYRPFGVTVNASCLMFTVFFITFGGMATTMPDLLNTHAIRAVASYSMFLASEGVFNDKK